VTETELMSRSVGGDTETIFGKLKSWKDFSEPNFQMGPSVSASCAVSNLFNLGGHKMGAQHYRDLRVSAFAE
jgi:hypothetical protein